MRVVLPQIPVSARAKDQERPRIPVLGQCLLHPTSLPLGPTPAGLFLCPISYPGRSECPPEGGTSGSEEGQGLKEGVVEEWGV